MERPVPDANRPRVEPEIIPPGRADPRSRRTASSDGTQRIYVAQVGPFGFAMVALVSRSSSPWFSCWCWARS